MLEHQIECQWISYLKTWKPSKPQYFSSSEGRYLSTQNPIFSKTIFKEQEEKKDISDKWKLREFACSTPTLKD